MSMIRWRTFSPSSFFLFSSFLLSGSRYPSAHCPSPRLRRGGADLGRVAVAPAAETPDMGAASSLIEIGRGHTPRQRPPPRHKKKAARLLAVRALWSNIADRALAAACDNKLNVGRQSACWATNRATDAEKIDVPAHDEHRVRNAHLARITQLSRVCPALVTHVGANHVSAAAIPAQPPFYREI